MKAQNQSRLNPRNSFQITLTMTSDWHIGSGTGRVDVDSLVQRDWDGLPYIPAKTLTGIWRDACELVACGLDDGHNDGVWQKWVNCLFGDQPALAETAIEIAPRPAALSIRSAHLPKSLRDALVQKPALKQAIAFLKPGVKIDPVSGCAEPDCLRLEEMVRQGAVLQADCKLSLPDNALQKQTAYALLVAGSQMVERLGGKRRRGAGGCKLSIDKDPKLWLEWMATVEHPPTPPEYSEPTALNPQNNPEFQEPTWYRIPLKITTKSPVIVAARKVGNVVKTLDYLPGTHLLPIIHKKLGQWLDVHQAISRGDLIITHATVAVDRVLGRPVPFCLFGEKLNGGLDKGQGVYNLLKESEPENIQLKGIRAGYVGTFTHDSLPKYKTVNCSIATHNTIQDEVQRPTGEIGGVYSYEAILPETELRAEIRLRTGLIQKQFTNSKKKTKSPKNTIPANWWKCLNGEDWVGQSKKDDYGLISLDVSQPVALPNTVEIQGSELTVWLLSDVLLRDDRLRPTASLDCFREQLQKALGVTLHEKEDKEQIFSFARQRRTDSWQVRWGLPRPSLAGLMAGSCMVYEVEGTLNPARVAEVEIKGIGERRAEGYGQLCFNDPLLTSKLSAKTGIEPKSNDSQNQLSLLPARDSAFNYARIIEKEAWREAIRRAALALAATRESRQRILGIKIEGDESKPPTSQLGALMSAIARLQELADSGLVTNWLDNLQQVGDRKEKWPNESLPKIRTLVTNLQQVWVELSPELSSPLGDLTLTRDAQPALKSELWAEAVRTLVDACIRAHKRDWENSEPAGV